MMNSTGKLCSLTLIAAALCAQEVTYVPYIQPGDAGPFGAADQMVVAWQTNEASPHAGNYTIRYGTSADLDHAAEIHPVGRVVDNYLAADPVLAALSIPTAYGAHTDYYGVLSGLRYETRYYYRVSGPGLPSAGFTGSFSTRTRKDHFSFQVQGDEGYYPGIPKAHPNDRQGAGLNDPIPDTVFDPVSLTVISTPATGTPALLDKVTVRKPELEGELETEWSSPERVQAAGMFQVELKLANHGHFALNGTQTVFTVPEGLQCTGATSGDVTVDKSKVIVSVGRLAVGDSRSVQLGLVASKPGAMRIGAQIQSATALPVDVDAAKILVKK